MVIFWKFNVVIDEFQFFFHFQELMIIGAMTRINHWYQKMTMFRRIKKLENNYLLNKIRYHSNFCTFVSIKEINSYKFTLKMYYRNLRTLTKTILSQKFRQIDFFLLKKNFTINWFDEKKFCVEVISSFFHTCARVTLTEKIKYICMYLIIFSLLNRNVTFTNFLPKKGKTKLPYYSVWHLVEQSFCEIERL